jgi:inorganic triphosphatase YgiF
MSRTARSLFDKLSTFARETVESAPAKATNAASLVREASKEIYEITKEKAPVVAEAALLSARTKLAVVLPFVKPSEESLPVAAE